MLESDKQSQVQSKKVRKSHDNFFKSAFHDKKTVRALLKLVLTRQQLAEIDLQTVKIEKQIWADLVVSCRFRNGSTLTMHFLCEHKSYPDRQLMLQLLRYQTDLYVNEGATAVLPITIYHGRNKNWAPQLDFQKAQLQAMPETCMESFAHLLLNFRNTMVNLHDAQVKNQLPDLPLEAQFPLQLMSEIWRADEQILVNLMSQIRPPIKKARARLVGICAHYLIDAKKQITIESIYEKMEHQPDGEQMSSEFAELLSTWYTEEELQERYREYANFKAMLAGRKEGLEEGCRKVAAKLIQSGMSIDEVSQITELPVETLESLQKEMIVDAGAKAY